MEQVEILDEGQLNQGADNVEYAGFWLRVGASIMDGLILIPAIGIMYYGLFFIKSLPVAIIGQLAMILYKPILEGKMSATLGKKIVHIKVVDQKGDDINMAQAFTRSVFYLASSAMAFIINISMMVDMDFIEIDGFMESNAYYQLHTNAALSTINTLLSVLYTVACIVVAFNKKKQGLHDQIAKTYVVKVD